MNNKAHEQTDDLGFSKACTPDVRNGLLRCPQIFQNSQRVHSWVRTKVVPHRHLTWWRQVSVTSVPAHSIQTTSTGSSPRLRQGAAADGDVLQKEAQVAGLRNASCL